MPDKKTNTLLIVETIEGLKNIKKSFTTEGTVNRETLDNAIKLLDAWNRVDERVRELDVSMMCEIMLRSQVLKIIKEETSL